MNKASIISFHLPSFPPSVHFSFIPSFTSLPPSLRSSLVFLAFVYQCACPCFPSPYSFLVLLSVLSFFSPLNSCLSNRYLYLSPTLFPFMYFSLSFPFPFSPYPLSASPSLSLSLFLPLLSSLSPFLYPLICFSSLLYPLPPSGPFPAVLRLRQYAPVRLSVSPSLPTTSF